MSAQDWTITTRMLLLTLLMGTGMPLSDIMITIFFDLVMIITGLVGALVASSYKWGFYVRLFFSSHETRPNSGQTFGCFAMFYVCLVSTPHALTLMQQ